MPTEDHPRPVLWLLRPLQRAEQAVYAITGVLLILALILALVGAGTLLFNGMKEWGAPDATIGIIDRLLYVLMLVEILHTVHASLQSGGLRCEPFLIVGLIACIRRILVITLETSQITQPDRWTPDKVSLFQSSMLELGILAGLIVVLIGAVFVIRRSPAPVGDEAEI